MATPYQQEYLAVGYLYTEGFINHRDEVLNVSLAPNGICVDVWVRSVEPAAQKRRVLTSGCGKGITFDSNRFDEDQFPPLEQDLRVSHPELVNYMQALKEGAYLYKEARGIHSAGLADQSGLVMMAEDIGRHNTIDRISGRCLLEGVDPSNHILLTTGRISSDMLNKARRLTTPVVVSRTSPTSLAVDRAKRWGITVIGYLRPDRMHVYSGRERVLSTLDTISRRSIDES